MSIDISKITNKNIEQELLKNILDTMLESRLLCDFYLDKLYKSSHGNCRIYSTVLQYYLNKNLSNYQWDIQGGWERNIEDKDRPNYVDEDNSHGGMFSDFNASYESHYWIHNKALGICLDTSGDQFGHANILIVNDDDSIYNANLDEFYISDEVRYDTTNEYSKECLSSIRDIKDPIARFNKIFEEILKCDGINEYIQYKEHEMEHEGYNDDMNDIFTSSAFKIT